MNEDEWLRDQLRDVGWDVFTKENPALKDVDKHIKLVIESAVISTGGRYDLGIVLMIMATGYALHTLLAHHPELAAQRNHSDEALEDTASQWTLADMESLFSAMGITMWKSLWRPLS